MVNSFIIGSGFVLVILVFDLVNSINGCTRLLY